MKAFNPVIVNSYRRLIVPSSVSVRFFAQNKGGGPPKGGNFQQPGKPNQQQKPQQQQQQQPKQNQQPFQQQKPQQQQQPPKQQQHQPAQQPKASQPPVQATPVSLTPEIIRRDLVSLFNQEIEEIKKDVAKTELANEIKQYLDKSGFRVEETEDGIFVLKKADKNYTIEVKFEENVKEEGAEEEEDFGGEDEMENDLGEDGGEEGEDTSNKDKVNFAAKVIVNGTAAPKGTFLAEGFVGADGRLYVEQVLISDSVTDEKKEPTSEEILLGMDKPLTGPALSFQDLPQLTQDKLYDFFDSLGIDDQLASFMKTYAQQYFHVKSEIEFYEKFKKIFG